MSGVLVVLEQHEGKLHGMSIEALAAAQQLGAELSQPVYAVVAGNGIQPVDGIAGPDFSSTGFMR